MKDNMKTVAIVIVGVGVILSNLLTSFEIAIGSNTRDRVTQFDPRSIQTVINNSNKTASYTHEILEFLKAHILRTVII